MTTWWPRLLATIVGLSGLMVYCHAQAPPIDKTNEPVHDRHDAYSALLLRLSDSAQTDLDKIKLIHGFVTQYMDYDTSDLKLGHSPAYTSMREVVERGKATCWGFSQLVTDLARTSGLEGHTVVGYVRDPYDQPGTTAFPDHAWNVVQIDGIYRLYDATWGRLVLQSADAFTRRYGTQYFLTPPEYFIKNHFPVLAFWQLLSCPVSFKSFSLSDTVSVERDCDRVYSFVDSISRFLSLPVLQQSWQEHQQAYRDNPSLNNRNAMGHSAVDIALAAKEKADSLLSLNDLDQAIAQYEIGLSMFAQADATTTLFAWQVEAYAYCHLNLAQTLIKAGQQKSSTERSRLQSLLAASRQLIVDRMQPSPLHEGILAHVEQLYNMVK